jgi:hypothetical protein
MEEAERGDGWLAWCEERGIFVAVTQELAAAVANVLRPLAGPCVEIAAGRGELALAVEAEGVAMEATDVEPGGDHVRRMNARDALEFYRPRTVVTCFTPLDASVEAAILGCPSVENYLYIGPLVNERPGPDGLWCAPGWDYEPVAAIDRELITRLDFLADFRRGSHQRRGGSVLARRVSK